MDGHARGGVAALLLFVLIGTTVHATTHFKLAPLPYSYAALEPAIDEATMRLHHDKHHQAYTDKFNKAIDEVLALELVVPSLVADNPSPLEILRELLSLPLPVALHTTIRNNGGGYVNHNMFWEVMKPGGSKEPPEELLSAIEKNFGSLEGMKEQFNAAAQGVFGSGWTFLSLRPGDGVLVVETTSNQNLPDFNAPILCLDVWEHAYYLQYQNRRPEYIANWWSTVNWDVVNEYFTEAVRKSKTLSTIDLL